MEQVLTFHQKYGHAAPDVYTSLTPEQARFRLKLMYEELGEIAQALGYEVRATENGATFSQRVRFVAPELLVNEVKLHDGLADLEFTVLGTWVSMGVRDGRFFETVCQSNLSKDLPEGPLDKPKKGPNFRKPEIELLLKRLKERASAGKT